MQLLTDADVAQLVSPGDALAAVRSAFAELASGTAAIQARERTSVGEVKLSTLGAVLRGAGVLGAKVYSTVNGRFSFLVALFSAEDGRRLAVLESDELTRLRTAATSVLSTLLLHGGPVGRLVVFGSGSQARAHATAFVDALGTTEVVLVGRTAPAAVADELAASLGIDVTPLASTSPLGPVLEPADAIVTATRSAAPLFDARLLPAGLHVCAVGSSRPDTRELGEHAFARARIVAVEWLPQARDEAGGLRHAVDAGVVGWDEVTELADLLDGDLPTRLGGDLTVFQSVGIGLLDVALAATAWRAAQTPEGQPAPGLA